jgi:hypothetical protein
LLVLQLPEATPSNNVIKGMHFRVYKKAREAWQCMVQDALQSARGSDSAALPPLDRCYLQIERHCAGAGLDWDNAYGGLKPLLDCLVAPSARNPDGLGVIRDDSPAHMPYAPSMTQHPAKKGAGRTVVRIYDASQIVFNPSPLLQ